MRTLALMPRFPELFKRLSKLEKELEELKKLEEETGMFGSISDEEVNTAAGKNYQDLTALRDPLMGLGYGEMNADTEPGAE